MAPLPGLLLVEGRDDMHFVQQLCNRTKLSNQTLFSIDPMRAAEDKGYSGSQEVVVRLRAELSKFAYLRIGVVVDADDRPDGVWESLRNVMLESGYPSDALPERAQRRPVVVGPHLDAVPPLPRVGIWIMPDNRSEGMLEDFVRRLVPSSDPLIALAEAAVDGVRSTVPERSGHGVEQRFGDVHRPKALIHTWLAWQPVPGTALGLALTRRYLDANHELFKSFEAWLREIFEAPLSSM